MKQLSEHQVSKSLTQVMPVVRRYRDDLNKVLEAFESTHDDKEAIESKQYQALIVGLYHLNKIITSVNNKLNNSNK